MALGLPGAREGDTEVTPDRHAPHLCVLTLSAASLALRNGHPLHERRTHPCPQEASKPEPRSPAWARAGPDSGCETETRCVLSLLCLVRRPTFPSVCSKSRVHLDLWVPCESV